MSESIPSSSKFAESCTRKVGKVNEAIMEKGVCSLCPNEISIKNGNTQVGIPNKKKILINLYQQMEVPPYLWSSISKPQRFPLCTDCFEGARLLWKNQIQTDSLAEQKRHLKEMLQMKAKEGNLAELQRAKGPVSSFSFRLLGYSKEMERLAQIRNAIAGDQPILVPITKVSSSSSSSSRDQASASSAFLPPTLTKSACSIPDMEIPQSPWAIVKSMTSFMKSPPGLDMEFAVDLRSDLSVNRLMEKDDDDVQIITPYCVCSGIKCQNQRL